ncbi:hypothetical protein BU25DRAFT_416031 [Macroventuria anomochaeta]|uniref:Uncharacterized protein n=1 Tax=Macroventuria anomochaeta TaxID=301207 RepID=A0ACB6RIB5_9PLEO|nr:uncharacterized protein BU25DRAFT_416031 [Macroventuria anomochaeta]KAF2621499.1 hypothetical protein BU25DRAFT_416031 [Macroventuria anomochaeta]
MVDGALLIGRPEHRLDKARAAHTNLKPRVRSIERSYLPLYRALTRGINNKASASPASPQFSEASTSTHSAADTTSTKLALPLIKMKISVITSMILALMAPVTHATTIFNNYRYADCQNPGVDRTAARDVCNYRVDSTHAIRLKQIDPGCVMRGWTSNDCSGTARMNLRTTNLCEPVVYGTDRRYSIRSWRLEC